MKKNIRKIVIFVALLCVQVSLAGPWEWVKDKGNWITDKANSVWLGYKRWSIPRPHLVYHKRTQIDGRACELFGYDLSQDTDAMKDLRKNLHVSGLYFADGSDENVCQMKIQPEQYFKNGLDLELNNSVSKSMYRLLSSVLESNRMKIAMPSEVAFMRLVWEIENCLPDAFDEDQDGRLFIAFVREMLTQDVAVSEIQELSQPQRVMQKKVPVKVAKGSSKKKAPSKQPQQRSEFDMLTSIVFQSMREDMARNAGVYGQRIEQYLLFWKKYTLRFRGNNGLRVAARNLRRAYGVE
jgi:hypothetical protein